MDLRQLRYFVMLAETRNFHRAAERLHMSQPPLTVAIRKLEDELGAPLFTRESRGVRLTAAGEAALPAAQAALEQAGLVREAVRLGDRGEIGSVAVGFVGSAVGELLPRVIPVFRKTYPRVDLRLEEMTSVAIVEAIATRQIEVGLVRLPVTRPQALDIDIVERDLLVVALPPGHALARRRSLRLAELAEEALILHRPLSVLHAIAMLACQRAGFSPRVAQEATQVQTILSLVQAGLGVALVPARMARFAPEGIRLLPLAEPVPIEMAIVRRPDADAPSRNFVEVALQPGDI